MGASSKAGGRAATASKMLRLFGSISPSFLGCLLLVFLCIVGAFYVWRHWELGSVARLGAKLSPENIEITPQPPWIKADVKAESFRDGSLSEWSCLDRELAYQVYRAFELHPWVAKVNRVSKQAPANVIVDLQYRQPIAWVEVPGNMSPNNVASVLPIDADAVLLPPDDLHEYVDRFLRISISGLANWGPIGTPWPDARVVGAARIADVVSDLREPLQLHRIVVLSQFTRHGQPEPLYELTSRQGHRFIWGSAPGHEKPGEASTTHKLHLLKEFIEHGQAGQAANRPIDLSRPLRSDSQTANGEIPNRR